MSLPSHITTDVRRAQGLWSSGAHNNQYFMELFLWKSFCIMFRTFPKWISFKKVLPFITNVLLLQTRHNGGRYYLFTISWKYLINNCVYSLIFVHWGCAGTEEVSLFAYPLLAQSHETCRRKRWKLLNLLDQRE